MHSVSTEQRHLSRSMERSSAKRPTGSPVFALKHDWQPESTRFFESLLRINKISPEMLSSCIYQKARVELTQRYADKGEMRTESQWVSCLVRCIKDQLSQTSNDYQSVRQKAQQALHKRGSS